MHTRLSKPFTVFRRQIRVMRLLWQHQDRHYGWRWRLANGMIAGLLLVGIAMPIIQAVAENSSYKLSADTLALVGNTNKALLDQLTFDASTQTYQFNKDAIKPDSSNPLANLQSQVGTASGNKKDKSLYALDVPQDIRKGVTYHDINSDLSFSLIPQFNAAPGKVVQGHLVYPLADHTQAIYTLKNNGLKEDIVVQNPTEDAMSFSYQLRLPATLEAKVIPGSDGAIGIYSADPSLFGNITYGSNADRARVEKARENADKTYLVFGLPSPVIKNTAGQQVGSARFQLQGQTLQLVATGLTQARGPVTIDPSVVVTSTSDFQAGNNEDNIDFSTSGQITRGGLTGGSLNSTAGSWTTSGNSLATAVQLATSVAYNGYIYLLGGENSSNAAVSTVSYAPLNTDGSIGSWNTTTSLPTATYGSTSVIYNGYIYELGGFSSSTTYYAPVASNGTIGTWNTTTALSTNTWYAASAAYNGYVYFMGGTDGSSPKSTTYYAAVHADGTLGSWTTTSTLISALSSASAAAYNGYLYETGGQNSAGTTISAVRYAPINADGTLGTWIGSGSLPSSRASSGTVAANGYLYVIGGTNGTTTQSTVYYAPLYANGRTGTWRTTTSLPQVDQNAAAATYNGYVYLLTGYNAAPLTTAYYSHIDPAGTTSSYATTTAYPTVPAPTTISDAGTVAYNGFIYIVGGNTGSVDTPDVEYAPLNTDGTIGTWTKITTGTGLLGTGVADAGVTVYNGYLYAIGGFTSGSTDTATVQYAQINSDGSVGAWATTTALSGGNANQQATTYNGYIYVGGGTNGGSGTSAVINYALICTGSNSGVGGCGSTAGTIGTWGTTSSLNTARNLGQMLAYGGYMYNIGGQTGGTALTSVEYAPINSDGTLGTWQTATNNMNLGRENFGAFISAGYLYVVGGQSTSSTSTETATTEYAPINSDGSLGTWQYNTSMSAVVAKSQITSYNGYVYVISGRQGGSRVSTSNYATINNGGNGATGSWTTNASGLPNSYANASTVAANGYIYMLGGDNSSAGAGASTYYSTVEYAPLNTTGSVGSWTATSSLITGRSLAATAVYNGYLYVLGGTNGSDLNDVQYAPINSNGTLGSWHYTHNSTDDGTSFVSGFATARSSAGAAVYNGYLYILGGSGTTVEYAALNSNGTVGTWATTSSFSGARSQLGVVAYGGYLYLLGGLTTGYANDVQFAKINSNGTLAAWAPTTSFNTGRAGVTAYALNGYMYIMGGRTSASNYLNDVQYAPMNSNGTVGTWMATASFTTPRSSPTNVVYNGYVYMIGGFDASTTYYDIQYAQLNSIARIAHYSKLIDLSSTVNVTGINYTSTGGSVTVQYRAAGSNGVFGSLGLTNNVSGVGGCQGNLTSTRYVWVLITLDGSLGQNGGATYPDVNGSHANLTDFTVNYNTTHPAPNIRLRAGQTLQSGVLSPLDTCYP